MNRFTPMLLLAAMVIAAPAAAQMPGDGLGGRLGGGRGGFMGPPRFLEHVYPPRLVMRHQEEIRLSADQRAAITAAMAETQKSLVELQWEHEAAVAKLDKLLEPSVVDAKAAAAQAERVMDVEGRMKRTHLGLLVRIKNLLSPAQQERLRTLRPQRSEFAPPPPPEE